MPTNSANSPSVNPAAIIETPPVAKTAAKKTSSASAKKPAKSPTKAAPAKKVVAKKTPAAVPSAALEKPTKAKKIKMVRDSFTIPKPEFAVLEDLKLRGAKMSVAVKKTELIRAGIKALASMNDANFLAAIRAVPSLKTGRPSKS